MPTLHFKTTMAITGLSRATLWRRIKEHPGSSETLGASKGHLETRIDLDSALTWAGLTLEDEDRALIPAADAGDAPAQRELGLLFPGVRMSGGCSNCSGMSQGSGAPCRRGGACSSVISPNWRAMGALR